MSTAPAARPFSPFELMLSRRYLGATRTGAGVSLISIIAFVGIMLAVATLIIVMSVMNGFRNDLLDKLLGFNGHIYVRSVDPLTDYEALTNTLRDVNGVVSATPLVEGFVMATTEFGQVFGQVRGVRKADLLATTAPIAERIDGSLAAFGDGRNGGNGLAVGSGLAGQLGLGVGDVVTLITARDQSAETAQTVMGRLMARTKDYEVVAVIEVGVSTYDDNVIFMPFEQAQLFFDSRGAAHHIELMVENPDRIDRARPAIEAAVAAPAYVVDWRQTFSSFFNALAIERNVMRLILSLIVAVAAMNIITGLIMLVKDKTADIAILRTMGATQGAIMRIFMLSGGLLGGAGTLAGVALGALFCWRIEDIHNVLSALFGVTLFNPEVYFLSTIPADMQVSEIAIVAGWSLFMSFVATLYPSWRASRLDPVEALRYE